MAFVSRPDGARIHYESAGPASGTPVLLLRAFGPEDPLDGWQNLPFDAVSALSATHRLLAVSARHSGQSIAPAAPFSYEVEAQDLLAVLDHAGVPAVAVLGHSAACPRALRLAMDAPERVRAMVLVWPVGLEEGTNTLGTFYQVFNETMRVARAEGMTAVVEAALNPTTPELRQIAGPFASVIRAEPAFREELRAMSVEAYITRIIRYRDGMWPEGHEFFSVPDSWPAAATLPTLILPGDDALHPAAVALRLCRLMPHARCLPPGWVQPEARAATATAVRETIG